MKNIFATFSLYLLLSISSVFAVEYPLLQTRDVNRIMGQIFTQHVDKKEITANILKHSFRVYIDQFDPERIYLLEEEITPYIDMDEKTLNTLIRDYKGDHFEAYEALNNTIQRAIFRARELRSEVEKNPDSLFSEASQKTNYDDWSDPDLKLKFSTSPGELKNRIAQHIIRFIEAEKRQFGEKKIMAYKKETLAIYNQHLTTGENKYLFVDEAGRPLSPPQRENLFIFHVLKALASSLDAHTTILNPAEAYEMKVRLEKGFQGVGIGLSLVDNRYLNVSSLTPDGPAAKSKQIRIGDRLVEVEGIKTENMPTDAVMNIIRGTSGASVNFIFSRSNAQGETETVPVSLRKETIAVQADRVETSYEAYEGGLIGKITLHSFYQGKNGVSSENDVNHAIKELRKKGTLKGLILDLRENSGGFLSQAVKVAGLFITNGVIVISKYSNGEEHYYRDMNKNVSYTGPLIVLTSKATASAAEIVAQALQDYGVALVVGDVQTYGKGTIQSQTVTDDNSTSFFKVTVGKYYTVSGKTPQIQGVKADIIIPSPFIDAHIGEEYLDYALPADTISSSYDDTLADIDAGQKSWYLQYYTPSLQQLTKKWRNMLSLLQENTSQRLQENQLYKKFIAAEQSKSVEGDTIRKQYWSEDVQMQEAVNIIKDMASLGFEDRQIKNTAESQIKKDAHGVP